MTWKKDKKGNWYIDLHDGKQDIGQSTIDLLKIFASNKRDDSQLQ